MLHFIIRPQAAITNAFADAADAGTAATRPSDCNCTHSTVSFVRCSGEFSSGDVFFCFSITYRRPPFNVPQYSEYQFFLYQTITEQRKTGSTFDQIAEWLNKKGYLSVRGKKFKGNHVHSIVKKKRLKDEKLEKDYPEVRTDFYLDIFDKTLVNMFEDFLG